MTGIGLACAGDPHDRWDWSGITAHVFAELQRLGHEPVWVDARPTGAPLHQARWAVTGMQVPAAVRSRAPGESLTAAARRLADAATLNARLHGLTARARHRRARAPAQLVQLRGDFLPVPGTRTVILEDATVSQVAEHGWWMFSRPVPGALTRRRIAHQRLAHRRAVASCAPSRWVADALIGDYGISPERVHIVGLGADALVAAPDRAWETPRFLWIGLDWERKGGARTVAAFRRVREQHPDAELHLVGHHPRIEAEGVTGHGRLDRGRAAERDRLASLLAAATCFVMPSVMEPAGMVYAEAGLAGLPSIGTSVGGAPTMIGPGGVLVDAGDEPGLVAAMLDLVRPERARALGAAAAAHAQNFTWTHVVQRLVRALDPGLADSLSYASFLDADDARPAVSAGSTRGS